MFIETYFPPNMTMPYSLEILMQEWMIRSKRNFISHQTNNLNPVCIDWILTNKPRSFQTVCVMEAGLSYFHRMTVSVSHYDQDY